MTGGRVVVPRPQHQITPGRRPAAARSAAGRRRPWPAARSASTVSPDRGGQRLGQQGRSSAMPSRAGGAPRRRPPARPACAAGRPPRRPGSSSSAARQRPQPPKPTARRPGAAPRPPPRPAPRLELRAGLEHSAASARARGQSSSPSASAAQVAGSRGPAVRRCSASRVAAVREQLRTSASSSAKNSLTPGAPPGPGRQPVRARRPRAPRLPVEAVGAAGGQLGDQLRPCRRPAGLRRCSPAAAPPRSRRRRAPRPASARPAGSAGRSHRPAGTPPATARTPSGVTVTPTPNPSTFEHMSDLRRGSDNLPSPDCGFEESWRASSKEIDQVYLTMDVAVRARQSSVRCPRSFPG